MTEPRKIPLSQATAEQLRWHASVIEGLDVTGANTVAKLIGLLGPAMGEKDFVLSFDAPVAEDEQSESTTIKVEPENDYSSIMQAPKITIKVMTTGGYGGKDDAFVSVNTKSLRIKRGVPVTVPYPFYEALTLAVPSVTQQTSDDDYELIETEASNYPVQVLEPVDMPAWLAFKARVAQQPLYA